MSEKVQLRQREQPQTPVADEGFEASLQKSSANLGEGAAKPHDGSLWSDYSVLEQFVGPIFFTLLGAFVRLYKIGASDRVVWDEAHFGKFGSFYLNHTYYFDVHPPLGKMLCGLSGYIAGYNGSFGFESGAHYPDYLDYTKMREFNAMFSILSVPVAYFTAKALKLSLPAVWLVSTMVALELSFIALARFILLDSMLIFFTTSTFLGLAKFHSYQRKPFTFGWFFWLAWTGASLGLTTSVKMVGLFVTALVGLYTVADLWIKLGDRKLTYFRQGAHLATRVALLIVVPILIFVACYKVHFMLLYKTGDGVATMSSLFKANLEGETTELGPLDVAYGSRVSIKNQGLGGGLLHSHIQTFPEGSKQQQVTTYGHMDANNEWSIEYARPEEMYNHNMPIQKLTNGDKVRLVHHMTGRNLHSHDIRAPVTKSSWEVSCYGNDTIGDEKDNWVVEIVESLGNEDSNLIHPLSTSVRFRHEVLGCYLANDGTQLPEWGFRQGEVACLPKASHRNKNTWWNVEQHWNERLPDAYDRELPKSRFLRDFVHLNVAQMQSNNALVPDSDKIDDLASSWWQWPLANRGLRMCGWDINYPRYYLLGTPTTIWLTTASIGVFLLSVLVYTLRYQRQITDFTWDSLEHFLVAGGLSFFGWFFHYVPFVIMSRVTYVHHYMPALYFAIFEFAFLIDWFAPTKYRTAIHWFFIALTAAIFYHFHDIGMGMSGPLEKYDHLRWFNSWHMGAH